MTTTGRVHTIRSHLRPDLVYIGSTKETLARRLAQHKVAYKGFVAGKSRFVTSYKLLEIGDAYIDLVELVNYTEKSQLASASAR